MSRPVTILTIAAFASACGPDVDDEERPPGELEYEDSMERVYRLDGRVDVIHDYEREDGVQRECGILTDRAYDELESTLAALDPNVDYGEHPTGCMPFQALVHVERFEHSPFECGFECCHRDLYRAVFVYTMVLNDFDGLVPIIDGEPYIAIEPDQPCP